MIGFRIDQAKGLFFDRALVLTKVSKTTRRVLSKFGAFVRTRAMTSMRRRKGVSAPDTPPYSHVGLLRKFLFFVFEESRESVVIGPAKLNGRVGNAPQALEEGGESDVAAGTRTRRQTRRVTIRRRPYMKPAFEAELPKVAGMYRDQVK